MLSILIPVYNYNVSSLVEALHKQCLESKIEFEIICQDDGSNSVLNKDNEKISLLENCFFHTKNNNIGRGGNINSLAQKAKHNWLLILDCDTFPAQNNFIKRYLDIITNTEENVAFGGILYENKKPQEEQYLRWIYGQKRETKSILTSNLLIKRNVFIQYPFDEVITKYGYEDLYFFSVLKSNHFEILCIENPTYHLNLETSIIFLNKTKTALENLILLYNSKKITSEESKILKTFDFIKKLRITPFLAFLFRKNQAKIELNLLSQKPSLFLFDLYKLGYYFNLKK